MQFEFTPEHEELRQAVRRFLENESGEAVVRGLMETERGYDERTWTRLASEMGLPGLSIPEANGGAGLGAVETAIVLEEMGRVLFCGPYFSTAVLAVAALTHAGDDAARAALFPEIAAGKTTATLALGGERGRFEPSAVAIEAKKDGGGFSLDGSVGFVIDGHTADVLLVAARTDEGLGLFRVEGSAKGLERELLPTLDLTRKLARVTFKKTPASRLGTGDASAALERVAALGVAALAAEQAGGAARCLEMATDYAKTRLQFGRPIGSYQAIKHKCADLLIQVEMAKSAAYHAAFQAAEGSDEELFTAAHMARAWCSEAYFQAAAETIQIHGGMGFTWEHPAHLYFKRAKASAVLFGDAAEHRRRLADRIGL